MNPLITICFRSGSKRLPDKNIKLMHDKPLWKWTYDVAEWWGRSTIVISTDYVEPRKENCMFIQRANNLCCNEVPKLEVIRDAHRKTEMSLGIMFDVVIDLDVTNPCRRLENISKAFSMLEDNDVVISAVKARRVPGYNVYPPIPDIYQNSGYPGYPWWELNANIYVYSRDFLAKQKEIINPIYANKVAIYEMPQHTAFDIDTEMDWNLVEFIMEKYGYV